MYMFGWTQAEATAFGCALARVSGVEDPRLRSKVAMIEAAVLCFTADYTAACVKAEESRRESRKAGVFFEYFAATLFLNWAHVHRGNLGQAIRIAKEDAELAARNGSTLPHLWLKFRTGWVQMEAFTFDQALAMYEEYAASPEVFSERHYYIRFLWLGQARLGIGNVDGAWDALEKINARLSQGGIAFTFVFPLTHARAECALARNDLSQAAALAESLIQTADERQEFSYAARGYRLLAEIDLRRGKYSSALDRVSQAEAALERGEAWTVGWRVHATAAQALARLDRHGEAAQARERSLQVASRVADTLLDEPALRQSFLSRVHRDLALAQTTSP